MSSRRNIRKRQFEVAKSLRLYKDYKSLHKYIIGDNANESSLSAFEANEKFDNLNKIAELFLKKKKNVIIPAINYKSEKEDKGNFSDKSSNTDISQILKKDCKGPIKFHFTPYGKPMPCYIKYKPKMIGIHQEQDFSQIDYMITEEHWSEVKTSHRKITENMRDLVEEIFDKFEKLTAKSDVLSLEKYKSKIQELTLITREKHPSEAEYKLIYSAWCSLRKKLSNPLLRIFWKKPDSNDNSPNASFRSRVTEKIQTRRKNKNDNSNYMKLKLLSKEIFSARSLLGKVMEREKSKLAILDLDYMELKQMVNERTQPDYKCEEYKDFLQNEQDRLKVEYPKDLIEPERSEIGEEVKEECSSLAGESNATSKNGNRNNNKNQDKVSISQPNPEVPHIKNEHKVVTPGSQQIDPRPQLVIPRTKQHEPVIVDPTTVMQISVLAKKLYYYGITADRNRIKINSVKPIK